MSKKTITILKYIFTISYFSILSYLVFFIRRRRGGYSFGVNLIPIKNLWRELGYLNGVGRLNYFSNIFGNILLFLPFPIILNFFLKVYKFSTVFLISMLLSITIESLQYIFKVGFADIDDVILNTMGACIGYFLITQCKKSVTSFFP